MYISYDDEIIPDFITVTSVKVQILPDIENRFIRAPRAIGVIDTGHNYGTKIIRIGFLIRDKNIGAIDKSEAIAMWLKAYNLKARRLILPSHSDSYFLAKPNNSIELDDGVNIFKGELEFICIDPFRTEIYETNVNYNLQSENKVNVYYTGSAITTPKLEIDVVSSCKNIKIRFKNDMYDNYINLQGTFNPGDKIKIDLNTLKIYRNDILDMKIWGLDSKKHKLYLGVNTYTIEESVNLSVKFNVKYF